MKKRMCLGMSIGMAIGFTLFDNSALGMCFGMSIGMLIGMLIGMEKDKKINKQLESEGYTVTDIFPVIEDGNELTVIIRNKNGVEKIISVSKAEIEAEEIQLNDLVYLDEETHLEKIDLDRIDKGVVSNMRFETDRLILRPWTEDDAESLFKYAKDPAVGPIAGWPVHTSVDNSRDIIKEVLSTDETYAVCLKEDNREIGSIGLIPPAQSHTKAADDEIEIGYWIGVPFWGKGLIPEAVRKLQEHAFLDLGCSAMWCGYYDGNEKSKKCQEKCGFTYHHTEENKPCVLMGDIRTEHFTRITREQWMNSLKTT